MNQTLSRVRVPFVEHLGIRLLEQSAARAAIVLEKRPELLNSWGAAHGGVLMTMLDYVMSAAVRGHYGVDGGVLTVDMSVGFMKAATGATIHAEGRVLHGGGTTAFCEAEARDDGGTLLAKAIGTFRLIQDKR
jgi:uncharacterized protein (TIGR00369 family)